MTDDASTFGSAEDLPDDARERLADLLLVLADNKRLLGMRYADWILGAPALEAGISCSAMAQDEWGHGRILYAMLRDFGRDPDELEHEREPEEYRGCELLDREPAGWPGLLALNLLLDSALTVQFEAMRESSFEPVHYKVSKLLDEERFHFEHARGWTARLATTADGRDALEEAFEPAWSACLRWFGEPDDAGAAVLADAGVVDAGPDELRSRWLARVAPVAADAGLELARREGGGWASLPAPDWNGWDADRRRPAAAPGPDTRIIERVRGDLNRELLLD
jgi:ring-1,2-phenylacetyl-CoA epoxidase subunit PaaC